MSKAVTIVMYHYVRPIAQGSYPGLRGLEPEQFRGQLDFIERHHQPISIEQLYGAIDDDAELPKRPALLQFDDGYADHFEYVAPELNRRNIKGTFFPITSCALDRRILVVHKIQFVLACVRDLDALIVEMERAIVEIGKGRVLPSIEEYRRRHYRATRIDPAPVIYVKRMFQVALPTDMSEDIAGLLFRRFVTSDERSFADDLYLSTDHLMSLLADGHHIGCHTDRHPWLGSLDKGAQRAEIVSALRMHDRLGLPRRNFSFCYPYGDYNGDTIDVLNELGCAGGFTAEVALARPSPSNRFTLPRLDTIDLPFDKSAPANEWTLKAAAAEAS